MAQDGECVSILLTREILRSIDIFEMLLKMIKRYFILRLVVEKVYLIFYYDI